MPEDRSNPLPGGAHLTRAIGLYRQGRYDRMEAEIRAELARNPENHEALTWLGLALFKLGRDDEALAVLADAVRLRPDYADAHYARALVLWNRALRDRLFEAILASVSEREANIVSEPARQAEEAIAEALRLNPKAPEYLDFLADMRRQQGRLDEALVLTERGLAHDPRHVNCLYNRALILDRLDQREQAREAYLAALAQAPETAGIHRDLGNLLLSMDAAGPALEHLREALRLQPNLEADVRPRIAEAMKRHSPLYNRLMKHIGSMWILLAFLPILALVILFGQDSRWPPLEVLNRMLPSGMGYVLLFLSFLAVIDPLYNLHLCRTEFGRLMLSDTERRQANAVAVCLGAAVCAGLWFLISGKYTPAILFLFCLFWIDPLTHVFALYPLVLRRMALVCMTLSVACVGLHLVARWFLADYETVWVVWYPYAMLLLGAGLFLLFVPFILSRSSDEFARWRPRARRRAVTVFWTVLLVAWFVSVAATYASKMGPDTLYHTLRQTALYAALLLGVTLYFEVNLIEWLAVRRFGGTPTNELR